MKKLLLFLAFILGLNTALVAQNNLFVFRDFRKAYKNGTRSKTGKPGPNYWQNSADYDINLSVHPAGNRLEGREQITYQNNSPDSLRYIVLKLNQNIFKKGQQRDYALPPSDITEGVTIRQLKVNGKRIQRSENIDFDAHYNLSGQKTNRRNPSGAYKISGTVMTIALPRRLLPSRSLNLDVHWRFHIPEKTLLRMGKRDSTTFFIGQWYPKVAVYDDINGWDRTAYTGRQEFYNNYGNFDVSIEAPSAYGVWATGILQNPREVYSNSLAQRIKQATAADSVTSLITARDYQSGSSPFNQSSQTNTWEFKARQVPEFAFAFSDHYLWDAAGLDVGDGRRIRVSAVYLKSSKHFNEVAGLARESIKFYSTRLPGVSFPFPQMTVVNGKRAGGDGMEYPMLCNNPTAPKRPRRVDVTAHEIAHNYFPFYVGTNERKYAWMDEGWADLLTTAYMEATKPWSTRLKRYVHQMNKGAGYNITALPLMALSTTERSGNYLFLSYYKPVMAYHFLDVYLGDKQFKKALQGYFKRWNHKHPTPYDFFYSFNDLTGQNLNWFWNAWFFELNNPDLSIAGVEKRKRGYQIRITNKGGLPLPVEIKLMYKNDSTKTLSKSLGIWKNRSQPVVIQANRNLKKVILGNDTIPDISPGDNTYKIEN